MSNFFQDDFRKNFQILRTTDTTIISHERCPEMFIQYDYCNIDTREQFTVTGGICTKSTMNSRCKNPMWEIAE